MFSTVLKIALIAGAFNLETASAHGHAHSHNVSHPNRPAVDPSFTARLLGKRDDHEHEEDHAESGSIVEQYLQQNREWAAAQSEEDLATWNEGQDPKVMWIGCSDSRVIPEILLGLSLGDVFVHRNVGNIVHPYDDNLMGVLEYAVANLKIEHIIVAGHTKCGGVHSVLEGIQETQMYVLDGWLTQMDLLMKDNEDELSELDEDEVWVRLAEMNSVDSAYVLNRTKVIRQARESGQTVNVYAMLYDIGEGILHEIDHYDS